MRLFRATRLLFSKLKQGEALLQEKNFQQALPHFVAHLQEAQDLNKDEFVQTHRNIQTCLIRLKKYRDAMTMNDELFELVQAPDYAMLTERALLLTIMKRYSDAHVVFEKMKPLAGNAQQLSDLYADLASLCLREHNVTLAMENLQIALQHDATRCTNTVIEVSKQLVTSGKWDEAMQWLTKVPSTAAIVRQQITILTHQGQYLQALELHQSALEKGTTKLEQFNFHFCKAFLLFKMQQYEEAVQEFDAALVIIPSQAEGTLYKAQCFIELDKSQEALALVNAVLAADPHHEFAMKLHFSMTQQL